jgi:hypothetical protein
MRHWMDVSGQFLPDRFVRKEDRHVPIRWEANGELEDRTGGDEKQKIPSPVHESNLHSPSFSHRQGGI